MAWFWLLLAGLLEIVWAFAMKQSDGFTRPLASVVTFVALVASFGLLAVAMKTLPLGTAYMAWTGIGAFVLGALLLAEPLSAARFVAAGFVLTGVVLLKLSS